MPTKVRRIGGGRVQVVTIDKYGSTRTYEFAMDRGLAVPVGSGRGYSPAALKALWEKGIPVEWSPEDLTRTERAKIDGFCDECGSELRQTRVATDAGDPEVWETKCENCDEVVAVDEVRA